MAELTESQVAALKVGEESGDFTLKPPRKTPYKMKVEENPGLKVVEFIDDGGDYARIYAFEGEEYDQWVANGRPDQWVRGYESL